MKGEPQTCDAYEAEGRLFSLLDSVAGNRQVSTEFSPAQLPKQLSDFDTSVKFKYQWK
jgi:hypothetical protein